MTTKRKKSVKACGISEGDVFHDEIGKITVMSIADGCALCRRPGCVPFVLVLADFKKAGLK